jgi:hypothetical protein
MAIKKPPSGGFFIECAQHECTPEQIEIPRQVDRGEGSEAQSTMATVRENVKHKLLTMFELHLLQFIAS